MCKREIKEELNIEIEVSKNSNSIYDYGFKINLIPLANYISGEIILSEHKDYKLIDKVELLNLLGRSRFTIVENFKSYEPGLYEELVTKLINL
jgi:8-oxo-dGTP diphosphatase